MNSDDFKDAAARSTDFADIKVLSFNLVAINGYAEAKGMELSNIAFNNNAEAPKFIDEDHNKAILNPNPMVTTSELYFYEEQAGTYTFNLYNLAGKQMRSHYQEGDTYAGQNVITVDRKSLSSGLYIYSLKSSTEKTWTGRLIIN